MCLLVQATLIRCPASRQARLPLRLVTVRQRSASSCSSRCVCRFCFHRPATAAWFSLVSSVMVCGTRWLTIPYTKARLTLATVTLGTSLFTWRKLQTLLRTQPTEGSFALDEPESQLLASVHMPVSYVEGHRLLCSQCLVR